MATKRKRQNPNMRGISRIDQPEKYNHGWFVRLHRKGKMYSAYCSDKKCGGKSKGLVKARAVYAKLLKAHSQMSRKEFAQIPRRPNPSGILGVSKVIKLVGGKKYAFWLATWNPKRGSSSKSLFQLPNTER